jgi:hypothetical protein
MGFVWLCCGRKPRGVKLGVHYITSGFFHAQSPYNYKNCYWLHYKSVTEFIANGNWPVTNLCLLTLLQTYLLLTSLQLFTYFITNCYWPVTNLITIFLLTSLQTVIDLLTSLQLLVLVFWVFTTDLLSLRNWGLYVLLYVQNNYKRKTNMCRKSLGPPHHPCCLIPIVSSSLSFCCAHHFVIDVPLAGAGAGSV